MASDPDRSYVFGPFRIDVAKRELYGSGGPVKLGRLVFDLLAILITNHQRAVSNAEISAQLWPHQQEVTDQNLKDLFRRLCKALDDDDPAHRKYLTRGDGHFRCTAVVEEVLHPPVRQASAIRAIQTKILYVKVLHLRQKGRDKPAYSARAQSNKNPIDVYDEALYYSLHIFPEKQTSWEWSIVTSGDAAVTQITHPWQDVPEYLDPYLADMRSPHLNPKSSGSSATYLTVTTMYNGLQKGQEQIYAKIETDAEYVRLVVDFASLADPKPVFKIRPVGTVESVRPPSARQVEVHEPYPLVFTASSRDMRPGHILKIKWSVVWQED